MISARIKDVDMVFETVPSVFSPHSIDTGTLAMLSVVDFLPHDKVLDLGCGYGVVGILAGKLIGEENVIMCDVSEQAIECTNKNLNLNNVPNIRIRLSDGYKDIEETNFTLILSNPPYHADFSVPKHFIEVGFKKLILGGKLVMVTKRLDWYKINWLLFLVALRFMKLMGIMSLLRKKERKLWKRKKKQQIIYQKNCNVNSNAIRLIDKNKVLIAEKLIELQ